VGSRDAGAEADRTGIVTGASTDSRCFEGLAADPNRTGLAQLTYAGGIHHDQNDCHRENWQEYAKQEQQAKARSTAPK
jgi:hypothetical protein